MTKRNKHGAIKTTLDNIKFDSKKEALQYLAFRDARNKGEITDLICHPTFQIEFLGVKICKVELDFMYRDKLGVLHHVDVKGFDKKTKKFRVTNESRIKKKLVEAQYNITVEYI